MAIDTERKRRSISGIALVPYCGVMPDSSKEKDWRFGSAGNYAGNYAYFINTAEKRRAISGIPLPLAVGVTPNADKDVYWRNQAGWNYANERYLFNLPYHRRYLVLREGIKFHSPLVEEQEQRKGFTDE